eukprot:11529743-Karenia_brevis.AAC.1
MPVAPAGPMASTYDSCHAKQAIAFTNPAAERNRFCLVRPGVCDACQAGGSDAVELRHLQWQTKHRLHRT